MRPRNADDRRRPSAVGPAGTWGSLGAAATDAGAVEIARRLLADPDRTLRLVTLADGTAVSSRSSRPIFTSSCSEPGTWDARSCASSARSPAA